MPIAFLLAVIFFLNVSPSLAQVLANPLYDQAMAHFNAGDYAHSVTMFHRLAQSGSHDADATYMYGLSLQRLGKIGDATSVYKAVIDRFPDSAAAIRAQSALEIYAPQYLTRWRVAHQEIGLGTPDAAPGMGIAPDLFPTWRIMPNWDVWIYKDNGSQKLVGALVNGRGFQAIFDNNSEFSWLGYNYLKDWHLVGASGKMSDLGESPTFRCNVSISKLHRQDFLFHLKENMKGPPIIGQDYLRNYRVEVIPSRHAIRLTKISTIDIAARFPHLNDKRKVNYLDHFDQPFRQEGRYRLVSVNVDGAQVQMNFGMQSVCQFSTEQLDRMNISYTGDNPDQANAQINAAGGASTVQIEQHITIRNMRMGKIMRQNVPAQVIDYTNARFQAFRFSGLNYPELGLEFLRGWTYKIDQQNQVIKFFKQKDIR